MSETRDISRSIDSLCEDAGAAGVGLSAWLEPDFIWISEIDRHPSAPAGQGAIWLCKLRDLAHAEGLPVRLCCTAWNSALIGYYARQGFGPIYEEGDEIFLEARPCAPRGPATRGPRSTQA